MAKTQIFLLVKSKFYKVLRTEVRKKKSVIN